MMAEQINIFAENKQGRLNTITGILFENDINIRAIVIADREKFGVIKILVDKPLFAYKALTDAGLACALKKVLAIIIDDKAGGLHDLTKTFSGRGIDIIDAYGFVIKSNMKAVLCVEVKDYDSAKAVVEDNGFRILADSDLYKL